MPWTSFCGEISSWTPCSYQSLQIIDLLVTTEDVMSHREAAHSIPVHQKAFQILLKGTSGLAKKHVCLRRPPRSYQKLVHKVL